MTTWEHGSMGAPTYAVRQRQATPGHARHQAQRLPSRRSWRLLRRWAGIPNTLPGGFAPWVLPYLERFVGGKGTLVQDCASHVLRSLARPGRGDGPHAGETLQSFFFLSLDDKMQHTDMIGVPGIGFLFGRGERERRLSHVFLEGVFSLSSRSPKSTASARPSSLASPTLTLRRLASPATGPLNLLPPNLLGARRLQIAPIVTNPSLLTGSQAASRPLSPAGPPHGSNQACMCGGPCVERPRRMPQQSPIPRQ
ncbi:hypothetical protein GQ53DRAFT_458448 [Thozetella sp. PMI_491]|nr:hypothetical protein GQ53DRAFT_458448 [Thozetella sp. PMI_491]